MEHTEPKIEHSVINLNENNNYRTLFRENYEILHL